MVPAVLLAWSPGVDQFILPKMVVLAVCLVALSMSKERQESPLLPPALLFLGVCVVSATLAPGQGALLGRPMSRFLGIVPISLLVLSLRFKWSLRGLDEAAIFLATWTIIERLYAEGRPISLIGSPTMLGCVLAMLLPLMKDRRATLLIAIAVFCTGSRAGMLAAGAAFAFQHRKHPRFGAGIAVAIVCAAAVSLQRVASDTGRINIWVLSARVWGVYPWFGCGPEGLLDAVRALGPGPFPMGKQFVDNAHNDWLMVASSLGLAGVWAYAWLHTRLIALLRGAEDPQIACAIALFVYSKLNPVPPVAVFLLIAVISNIKHLPAGTSRIDSLVAGALAVQMGIALASDSLMALGLRRMRQDARGGLELVLASNSLAPSTLGFQLCAQHLTGKWEATGNPGFLKAELPIANAGVDAFPASAQMRQIHATTLALLSRHDLSYRDSARISIRQTVKMDPKLTPGGTWME